MAHYIQHVQQIYNHDNMKLIYKHYKNVKMILSIGLLFDVRQNKALYNFHSIKQPLENQSYHFDYDNIYLIDIIETMARTLNSETEMLIAFNVFKVFDI